MVPHIRGPLIELQLYLTLSIFNLTIYPKRFKSDFSFDNFVYGIIAKRENAGLAPEFKKKI